MQVRCSAVVIVRTVNNSISAGGTISTRAHTREKGQVNSDTKKIRTYRSLILLEMRQARIILRVTVSAVSDL